MRTRAKEKLIRDWERMEKAAAEVAGDDEYYFIQINKIRYGGMSNTRPRRRYSIQTGNTPGVSNAATATKAITALRRAVEGK